MQEQLAANPMNLRRPETFTAATDQVQGFADRLQTLLDASGAQARVRECRHVEREEMLRPAGGQCLDMFPCQGQTFVRAPKLG